LSSSVVIAAGADDDDDDDDTLCYIQCVHTKNKANFFLAYSVIKPQLNALIFGRVI